MVGEKPELQVEVLYIGKGLTTLATGEEDNMCQLEMYLIIKHTNIITDQHADILLQDWSKIKLDALKKLLKLAWRDREERGSKY